MRIALTITELDPGGAEQCLVQLAIFLSQRGHDVQVFALGPTPERTLGDSTNRELLTELLNQHRIPWKTGNASGLASLPRTIRWLRQELRQFAPVVVQSMLFHANFVTAVANRQLNIPHFGGARVSQPSLLRRLATRWSAGRMQRLVCVSQAVARKCIEQEGIAESRISVIPNGVTGSKVDVSCPSSCLVHPSIPTEVPLLLFVGRLSQQKGILPLVQQVDRLLGKLPQYHFAILGDGPLKQSIQAAAAQAACQDRVHILGWQPHALQWIQRSNILLLPSNYEGMPNVIMEAMSCSKPVVTFNVEGIDELLPGDDLQVVSEFSLPKFFENVHRIALNPEIASKLAIRNRDQIEQNFRLEVQLSKYEQLYLNHIGRSETQ